MFRLIILSNNKKLDFLVSSGMMGFDGRGATVFHKILYKILKAMGLFDPSLFAIVTKTITLLPKNGPKEIKPLNDGWWNNYGLDNPGVYVFVKKYSQEIKRRKNLIVSIAGKTKEELRNIMIALLSEFSNLVAIEYNVSCPNDIKIGAKEVIKIVKYLANSFDIPVILKVGQGSNHYLKIAEETQGMVAALSINSIPANGVGAISGKIAQSVNWKILKELADTVSTPIIASSIWDYEDIEKVFSKGARAVSFGSMSMIHPKRPWGPVLPTRWIEEYKKEQEKKDYYLKSSAWSKSNGGK